MSKFPSSENFKNHKTKPQEFVERFLPTSSYLSMWNIFPKKLRKCYIYDILGQKFVDFHLEFGKHYLGFSDKYISKMAKNYLKSTVFSTFNGIFTYRFLKLLQKLIGDRFKNFLFVENEVLLEKVLAQLRVKYLWQPFSPFGENFEIAISHIPVEQKILDLRGGFRYPQIVENLKNSLASCVILWVGKFYVVALEDGVNVEINERKPLSEFEAMLGYYYLIREKFLVSKKLHRLETFSKRWLGKFVESEVADKLTPYGIKLKETTVPFDEVSEKLVKEGILVPHSGNMFFSFQHEENDFKRLRRKLNQVLSIVK